MKESGDFKRPGAGAYICKITAVEDLPKKEYLKVTYDIAEGEFAGYYVEGRKNNPDWEWFGVYTKSYKETALGMFKRFCSAVSSSNGKYVFDGGSVNSDENTLVGKKIGLNFGEEEYYGNDGELKTRLRVVSEFPIDKINDQKVPALKKIKEATTTKPDSDGFLKAGSDADVPFI